MLFNSAIDIMIVGVLIVGLIVLGLYFLNRWASKKMDTQETLIKNSKQTMSIYVIDKKKDKITNVNMPKMVTEQMPKYSKLIKMHFVQGKVGPQILTFMCDKNAYNAIEPKKTIKAEVAGIYIIKVQGMKTKEELKEIKTKQKEKAKAKAKEEKNKK